MNDTNSKHFLLAICHCLTFVLDMPVVMFNGKYNHNDTESLLFYSYKIFKTVKTNATHFPQAEPDPHLYYFAPVDTAGARQ